MIAGRITAGVLGAALVLWTVGGALRTVVLPRATSSLVVRAVFGGVRHLVFDPLARPQRSFETRDGIMAMYGPVCLILLPAVWVTLVCAGFAAVFWSAGVHPVSEAFITSGSSLLTLGFARPPSTGLVGLGFAEAVIGLGLVSLLISYLPSIYGAFAKRETLVAMLEVRAGLPPSPAQLLIRYSRIGFLDEIETELFTTWEQWFAEVEESHTSQPALVFFRSPQARRSWITAAGCVLDTAAIVASVVDKPRNGRADVTLRGGFLCLRRIADSFHLVYDPDPQPGGTISVHRQEFDELLDQLCAAGVPVKPDREQAWLDYAGWRINYDETLLGLCDLVMAPPAAWSSDRSAGFSARRRRR